MYTSEYLFKVYRGDHSLNITKHCDSDEEALAMVEELKEQYKDVIRVEVLVKYVEWHSVGIE